MKVTIQVHGSWHSLRLAEQLEERDALNKLVTKCSKRYIRDRREEVPLEKVDSIPLSILSRRLEKIPGVSRSDIDLYMNSAFENLASWKVGNPDIFVGWSGTSLKSIRKANDRGAVTIVERGSAHVGYQQEVLEEEYQRFEMRGMEEDKIEKELMEYEEADYIAVPSEFAKNTFLDKGIDENKLIKTTLGTDIEDLKPLESNGEEIDFLYVGTNDVRKGLIYLLEAWNSFPKEESELFVRASFNEEVNDIFYEAKGENMTFIEEYIQDLDDLYQKADVLVLPSIEDGFARVVTEAMACGMPVIVSENTGAKELVEEGENGFIVPIKDIEALKEKMSYFKQNPAEVERMGKNARDTAMKYTWGNYGEEVEKEYRRILAD
jgi:glycosyltransferase involved in cell wall biosynthesis